MINEKKSFITKKTAAWLALICLVFPMFGSYFFDDMFSTLSQIFNNPDMLELGWNTADYGYYAGGYSVLCVFGGLIICGILLDLYGVRIVGSSFVGLMLIGASIVTYALTSGFAPAKSLKIAWFGCTLFGLGSEIAGVAVSRSIAKWFKGRNLALAMGLHLSIARLGNAAAFILAPIIVHEKAAGEIYTLAETAKPAFVGLSLIFIGTILWGIFVAMDAKFDKAMGVEVKKGEISEENEFHVSDIGKLLTNPRFLMISLLCVSFYCCIISFKKFGSAILIPRFGMETDSAAWALSMIPFFTIIFTPLFGAMVDKLGKATFWMIVGTFLVLGSHLIIAFGPQDVPAMGYISIAILGIGFCLVPSAMWPTVPKLVPEKNLGTAFSLIYWFQNMGMMLVPIIIGQILNKGENAPLDIQVSASVHSEYLFIGLAIFAIAIGFILKMSSEKHPELEIDKPAGQKS